MSIYQFNAQTIDHKEKSLEDYKGKVVLIVNTATKCGLKNQFNSLETLYQNYKDEGFVVLGFPSNQFLNQEPGTDEEVSQACQLNFGVTFPLFSKVNVNGKNAHPLFRYLTIEQSSLLGGTIKWNFTKFLIDREGHLVSRFAPKTKPETFEKDIVKLL
ncbi:glutathione peroxidase [Halolactibacillus alkaliphilus]|uniref:Glutathione peroxidase n=1 Tax=Halolactibacillus alkaliphilus TaxID=442899 RepID=A0A511X0X7_9BACI|nr:glutathione peroxidase [Halolactibacillus alkaliphilus]GEN56595.1 glutathione peroxidase [Halolactibacillus alkaliphilus]GGN69694.1 glutathione peroxidase [Halolactibacillus alkaliphilus]SFO76344.1 glutathione peroxidase [Halolactibacillus alkaliphilus]